MSEAFKPGRYSKVLRAILILVGLLLITIALLADRIGFGEPGTFGVGQLFQIILGTFIVLSGFLGKSFIPFYKGFSIILLNTLLILLVMELAAIALARSGLVLFHADQSFSRYQQLPYHRAQEWSEVYWHEAKQAESYRYKPYVIWRHNPYTGVLVNIDEEGIRYTPGADWQPEALKIFTFGGSSMWWGWGSPDWGTIAAYLQQGINEIVASPVCVINFSEDAYVSTQSMISLILELQKGNIPDIVIFYDGVNDVYVAYESGEPGAHPMLGDIAARFEDSESGLVRLLRGTRLFWLAKNLRI